MQIRVEKKEQSILSEEAKELDLFASLKTQRKLTHQG
jgi:hypothetical protein